MCEVSSAPQLSNGKRSMRLEERPKELSILPVQSEITKLPSLVVVLKEKAAQNCRERYWRAFFYLDAVVLWPFFSF